jgi:hypothetical protein
MFERVEAWVLAAPPSAFITQPDAATVNPPIFKKWRLVIMV